MLRAVDIVTPERVVAGIAATQISRMAYRHTPGNFLVKSLAASSAFAAGYGGGYLAADVISRIYGPESNPNSAFRLREIDPRLRGNVILNENKEQVLTRDRTHAEIHDLVKKMGELRSGTSATSKLILF